MLLLVIIIGCGFHPVFAASGDVSFLDWLASLLDKAIKIGSRAWIPLATLAGKFMSNDMVYGSRFHLDGYLWQMRNMSKNFANFGILGFLLWEIIQSVTSKKVNIQQILGKAVVAGITIQMSWFLVGAVIDISTITTTAVGGFPASFLNASAAGGAMDTRIEQTIKQGTITLDEKAYPSRSTIETINDETTAQTKDKFMPKYDSVWGPLVFIGASALWIQDMMTSQKGADQDAKSVLVTFWLKGFILVFYIIILLLLLIANIMRVGYLRVFIAISPLLILMKVFSKWQGFGAKWFWSQLTFENLIWMIFKPTLFVGVMGIILIFVTSIQSILLTSPSINGATITQSANGSKVEIEGVASVTTNEKILSDVGGTVQNIIPNLIVYLATLFLLRVLVKLSLSSGKDPISGIMKKAVGEKGRDWFIENMAKTTPFMNGLSINSSKEVSTQMLNKIGVAAGFDNLEKFTSKERGKMDNTKFEEGLRKWTGWSIEWKTREFEELQKIAKDGWDFLGKTKEIMASEGHIGLTGKWESYGAWEAWLKEWIAKDTKKTGLSKIYTEPKDISKDDWKKIHIGLGWSEKDAPISYDDFKKKEYK